MSLKAFHIVFIILATLLSALCSVWAFANHAGAIFGACSAVAAVVLSFYGVWFVRKSRRIIT